MGHVVGVQTVARVKRIHAHPRQHRFVVDVARSNLLIVRQQELLVMVEVESRSEKTSDLGRGQLFAAEGCWLR